VFAGHEFIEGVVSNITLRQIAADLNALCLREGVIGYHYTRAMKRDIEALGLQPSSCADRQREFIRKHAGRFSDTQRERLHQAWKAYFDTTQSRIRDGRVWFNFTLSALVNGGADRLLTYFGGEAVYMPLTRDSEIASILRTIGEPLVVECALAPEKLHTFSELPWGTIWLSTYHATIKPDSVQWDVDAYLTERVPLNQITSIHIAEADPSSVPTRWTIAPN